jgi:glycosyltransferase involved in cell wall biosynthesis
MEIAKLLPEFISMGFYTVYDILDDWSEFAKRGQATWYDADVENFILRNVYKRYAVSQGLIAKHSKYDIEFLPNGFTAEQLTDSPKVDLVRGKINLGYFGHLTKEWFDWNLILAVAKKYPDIFIHIIGYSFPEGMELPDNVKYYGKLLPSQLSGYTKNWDVCLIPFQDIELSKSVNPIKVYEYLYLGKPVVVTGIPGLDKFPYVYFSANDVESFMNAVKKAIDNKVDYEKVTDFLKKNRWEDRAEIILARK